VVVPIPFSHVAVAVEAFGSRVLGAIGWVPLLFPLPPRRERARVREGRGTRHRRGPLTPTLSPDAGARS